MTADTISSTERGKTFREWLEFCIQVACFNPDASDPKAATILENVLREYDSRFEAALREPAPVGAGVREAVICLMRNEADQHPETAAYNSGWNEALGEVLHILPDTARIEAEARS